MTAPRSIPSTGPSPKRASILAAVASTVDIAEAGVANVGDDRVLVMIPVRRPRRKRAGDPPGKTSAVTYGAARLFRRILPRPYASAKIAACTRHLFEAILINNSDAERTLVAESSGWMITKNPSMTLARMVPVNVWDQVWPLSLDLPSHVTVCSFCVMT
jgi:hypothetical protein